MTEVKSVVKIVNQEVVVPDPATPTAIMKSLTTKISDKPNKAS